MSLRIIAHLDMDAFFASVEEAITPGFKGKPIAVGTEPNEGNARGVVSTANYKAREYGIHSAMPISVAWRLSEEAKKEGKEGVVFLPVDMELYCKSSQNILHIIKKYLPSNQTIKKQKVIKSDGEQSLRYESEDNIEQGSIDEFYFNLSFAKTFKKAEIICKKIKKEIKDKENITCSVGLGPNKLIAKIAAGINKPDGMLVIGKEHIQEFLDPLDIRELPGIGPKTAELFYSKNIRIIKDINNLSKEEFKAVMGKSGERMYYMAKGIDDEPITENREAKSMGEQVTFDSNSLDALYICEAFKVLSADVFKKFIETNFSTFSNITITIRFSDFETKTVSRSFKKPINKEDGKRMELEVLRMVLPFLDHRSNPKLKLIRLIGVKIEKLDNYPIQKCLFK